MKTAIALFSLAFSYSIFACTQEAQFIGTVVSHRVKSNNECVFQVEGYRWFGPSYVCPLVPGEVSGYQFSDATCSLKNGDEISGVFIKTGDEIVIY